MHEHKYVERVVDLTDPARTPTQSTSAFLSRMLIL